NLYANCRPGLFDSSISLLMDATGTRSEGPALSSGPPGVSGGPPDTGLLIINADDWGRAHDATERILECFLCGTVSSVSAMVFMRDSERAAAMARESKIDAGLHLNFTTPFTASECPALLVERQRKLAGYLLRHPLSQVFFHPGLTRSFEYVVAAQLEEFSRLYGAAPQRLDGHHHMHLCANVLFARILPSGTLVRRNFSFRPGEKSLPNRFYRKMVDRMLACRHPILDFLFPLLPLESTDRLQEVFSLARRSVVEVETHPVNPAEHRFLTEGEILRRTQDIPIASSFARPRPWQVGRGVMAGSQE